MTTKDKLEGFELINVELYKGLWINYIEDTDEIDIIITLGTHDNIHREFTLSMEDFLSIYSYMSDTGALDSLK
ncbi:hypothetical protein vBBceHLY2_00130 [Bacillus phage vB_BceH_LY2]|nr:hypothetical protein vBBceHLY2_00130 [Bacillus phage vB_BceH_LY2]